MKLRVDVTLFWMLYFMESLQADESLTFSLPADGSTLPTASFWHGTILSTLFENDIQIKIYLNKPQGLLFYAIDNLYKSFWIEFQESNMIISYYDFKIEDIYSYPFNLRQICNLQDIEDVSLNFKFSLNNKYLTMKCNNIEGKVLYSPDSYLFKNNSEIKLLAKIKKPIPNFKFYNGSITFMWIGNIPTITTDLYSIMKLKFLKDQFYGCVQFLKEGVLQINFVTAGKHQGNMIETSCDRVCDKNPCYNNVKCSERWRQRFSCNCDKTPFVGQTCNESYALEFDGKQFIEFEISDKLQQLRYNFYGMFLKSGFQGAKIISIKFVFEQYLIIYLDSRRNIQIMFITYNSEVIENTIQFQLQSRRNYTFVISLLNANLRFKLIDDYIVKEVGLEGTYTNLKMEKILVAGSHSKKMNWMKSFEGCISNLLITSDKNIFLWNTIANYSSFPKCGNKKLTLPSKSKKSSSKMKSNSNISLISAKPEQKNIAIIIIPVFVFIIIVALIIFLVCKFKKKFKRKKIFTNEKLISTQRTLELSSTRQNDIQNINIPYKRAYKAGSSSYLSNEGRSIVSLPMSFTDEDL